MPYRVAIYCPDQHLRYDVDMLDRVGVGGGVTARIRVAHALAARGHEVTAYVNCPAEGTVAGVRYRRCDCLTYLSTEIFVASSSGGAYDLSALRAVDVQARLRLVMLHGTAPPGGLNALPFDYLYAPGNFIRAVAVNEWGVAAERVFVSPRGVAGRLFSTTQAGAPARDPYSLVYAAHPSKGLPAAVQVLQCLRERDARFALHVYGGARLWGGEEQAIESQPGLHYHGLVGQRELARRLQTHGFSLNLQTRQEPFGMVVIESMRAGCIVLASPVGAYPEIIRHGENGFLVPGDPHAPATHERAAALIRELLSQPDELDGVRARARATPLKWDTIAQAWEGHWDWALNGRAADGSAGECAACGGCRLRLADGLHCTQCGRYCRGLA